MSDQPLSPTLDAALDLAQPLARRFAEAGYHFYLVGGVVRDSYLGIDRVESDLDATTEARPEQIKSIVTELADAVWAQGERFGTIGCRIDGDVYEVTTHRAETYDQASRKPVVAFGDRLDDDLSRRDFTVNAMAVDVLERSVIDLFGGLTDLREGVLRTPLDPSISFSDDPLRMLRAARFHSGYGLIPVPELTTAIADMADRLDIVSAERVRDELEKLVLLPDPGPGFELLRATGLMVKVLPELASFDRGQLEDLVSRVEAVQPSVVQRWAALLGEESAAGRRLRELKSARVVIDDTELLLRLANQVEGSSGLDDSDVRRLASMGGARIRLETVIDWLRRIRTADGRGVEQLDALGAILGRLRNTEADLDDPDVGLDGNEICALLEIEPGVDVGRAVAWLKDLRYARGVLPNDELRRELSDWWRSGAQSAGPDRQGDR